MLIFEVVRQRKTTTLRHGIETLLAAAQQMSDWRDWYVRHEPLIAELFGEDAGLFRSLLAATSQRTKVPVNVALALKAYQQFKRGEPFTGYLPQVTGNLERLRQRQQMVGQKVVDFAAAMDQAGDRIAVDHHITELLFGNRRPSREQIIKAKETINLIANRLGWQPREVQATLWAYNQVIRGGRRKTNIFSYEHVLNKLRDQISQVRQALGQISQEKYAA